MACLANRYTSWVVFLVVVVSLNLTDLSNKAHAKTKLAYGKAPVRLSYFDHTKKDKLTILVFGDSGTGKSAQYRVGQAMYNVCKYRKCDFAIGLGDNIYSRGVSSIFKKKLYTHFEKPYRRFGRFDFWMISGNHDWKKSMRAQVEYSHFSDRWRMPYYHYEIPALPKWIAIYGFDTEKINDAQVMISRKTLCRNGKQWKFIFGHHPIYSHGKHGHSKTMKRKLLNLIEGCGVDVFFAGHDHHQEHITAQKFEQIIQGAAGKLRKIKRVSYKPGKEIKQNYIVKTYGFSIVEVDPKRINIRFYNDRGRQIYSWSASKSDIGLP